MGVASDLLAFMRDLAVMTHRVDQALETAREADRRSLDAMERLTRIETILEIAMRGQARLPH